MVVHRVTAVVLAYGPEPLLRTCVDALLSSTEVDVDVVLVDNGCTTAAVTDLSGRAGVSVLRPGRNTGFAGGCNLGASGARSPFLAFVNSDAVVQPDALSRLVAAATPEPVGLVSASLRLADRPEIVNSVGNPVHFAGLSWSGGFGDDAAAHPAATEVTSVTGAALVCRREVFETLGGFCELMFAYCEDAELSLRAWQLGWTCRYVPEAVVLHHYEFSRNPRKNYLLERNRLVLLLTLLQRRTLLLLLPALVALEIAVLAVATQQGWARQKLSGYAWLLRHRRELQTRRALVQRSRTRGDDVLAPLLTGDFDPSPETGMTAPVWLRRGSAAYWSLVRRHL